MKKMRRFAAIAAAAAMTACMAVPMMSMMSASAADITITGVQDGYAGDAEKHTYEAYQIFAGTLSGGVLSNIVWGSSVDVWDENNELDAAKQNELITAIKAIDIGTADAPNKPFDLTTVKDAESVAGVLATITTHDAALTKAFAKAIDDYLLNNAVASDATGKISGLADGYYLVQDAAAPTDGDDAGTAVTASRTRYILKVAGEGVTVSVKSSVPEVMKKVKEESYQNNDAVNFNGDYTVGAGYNDVADYDIGDDVPFRLYGTMPSSLGDYDHYYYKFTDTLGSEFTFGNDVAVKVNGTTNVPQKVGEHVNYTVEPTENGFTVEFADVKNLWSDANGTVISVGTTDRIVVDYTAKLNANAKVGYDGQINGVSLKFSNNPNQEYNPWDTSNENDTPDTGDTEEDGVIVFTYGFDINKVISGSQTKLAGAKFAVYYMDGETKRYIKTDDNNCYAGNLEAAPTKETEVGNDKGLWVSSDAEGVNIVIKGLDKDKTYYVEEIAAPATYNDLDAPVEVTIASTFDENGIYQQNWTYSTSKNGTAGSYTALDNITVSDGTNTDTATADDMATITIANSQGSTLPSTGGIGTTLFYVIGGTLAAGAGVSLIAKKRMKNED